MADSDDQSLQALVAHVAAGYFTNSHVPLGEIRSVIQQIADSLAGIGSAGDGDFAETQAKPALTRAQIRKSITPDALISFEDGKPYKTLRRHLATRGLTPAQYREKWGLPSDYPMVSANYSEARSTLAKALGLGQRGQQARRKGAAGIKAKAPKRAAASKRATATK
jgi:predicted transcriptional regulator